MTTRRTFLGAALGAGAVAFGRSGEPIKLGVASCSFRQWSREKMIEGVQALETPYVSIEETHLRYTSTPAEFVQARREFAAAGLQVLGGGDIDLTGDERQVRSMFTYAKAAGFPLMVCAPSHANLGLVDRFVKEYNIRAAIHNHGPEDKEFPTPQSVLEAIQALDQRVGLCIDAGHTVRAGADVVEWMIQAGPRLLDMRLMDLKDLKSAASQCIAGEGKIPIQDIFAQLIKTNYQGGAMLEYEIEPENPLPGMRKSFENMRRMLKELTA